MADAQDELIDLLLSSDGGLMEGLAACGFAVTCFSASGESQELIKGGRFLGPYWTVLAAELAGALDALEFTALLLQIPLQD